MLSRQNAASNAERTIINRRMIHDPRLCDSPDISIWSPSHVGTVEVAPCAIDGIMIGVFLREGLDCLKRPPLVAVQVLDPDNRNQPVLDNKVIARRRMSVAKLQHIENLMVVMTGIVDHEQGPR